ncbi:hypothetical protein GCM10022223_24740 [Kineosporia mesophila]|uniref:Chemotaxis phosphatase CheX-like domain-containing protein n=1 Tax=Kineosporia mesophila TaxID=566012 RepID=A0ABP6ZGF5_9ACTN|nr:hypothetical protein [Kineosporia mesophila]MCD5350639.1 hypothetical protein [Kineosporia mesophila]
MSVFTELDDDAREELGVILTDVFSSVLKEEAIVTNNQLPVGNTAVSRLAIHNFADDNDQSEEQFAVIEVRVGVSLARVMAARMMSISSPGPNDLVDAIAEISNIAGGNVKTLLCNHARLSLPTAEIIDDERFEEAEPADGSTCVRAVVLGHVVQLAIHPHAPVAGLLWPPEINDATLEPTS